MLIFFLYQPYFKILLSIYFSRCFHSCCSCFALIPHNFLHYTINFNDCKKSHVPGHLSGAFLGEVDVPQTADSWNCKIVCGIKCG